MKKPKSRHTIIHCNSTPQITASCDSGITIKVTAIGHPHKAVSFQLGWWQYKKMSEDIRESARMQARILNDRASNIIFNTTQNAP